MAANDPVMMGQMVLIREQMVGSCRQWIGCAWLLAVSSLLQAHTLQLQLQADATVNAAQITLGDLLQAPPLSADVTQKPVVVQSQSLPPSPTLQAWPQIVLAKAPLVGQVMYLSRQEIEHGLRRVYLERDLHIVWQGAQGVKIRRAQQNVEMQTLVAAAQQVLAQALSARGQHARAILLAEPAALAVPAGQIGIAARSLQAEHLQPRMPVWLDISVDGVFYRSLSLMFALDGELGAPQDRVLRGASVALQVVQGGVVVETRAVVQQDAMLGTLVKVKPEHAAEPVLARVRSSTMVQLE